MDGKISYKFEFVIVFAIPIFTFMMTTIWSIYGDIIRFGRNGTIAADRLLKDSGRFMQVWLITVNTILGMVWVGTFLFCIYMCLLFLRRRRRH